MSKALAVFVCGAALAGCAASGDLMKTATPTVPLQFESEPAGAEVTTSGGQTCRTPCALAVPAADMQVTYSLNGYQPQTVAVKLIPPEDIRGGGEESGVTFTEPRFDPSPVMAELVKAAPTRRPAKKVRAPKQPAASSAAAEQPEPGDGGRAPTSSTGGFNPPPPANSGGFTPPPAAPGGGWPAPR